MKNLCLRTFLSHQSSRQMLVLGSVLALGFSTGHFARAQANVYEGFSYANGQDITTVPTTATGLGNWTTATGGIVGTTSSTNLTFGQLVTSGGSLLVTKPAGGGWQFLAAPISAAGAIANGSTLYASYLFQFVGPNGGVGAGDNFGLSVANTTGADHTISLLAQSYAQNPAIGRVGYNDGNYSALNTGNTVFDASVYIYIGKWTNLGGSSTATGWVLSLANFNAVTSMGPVTESALNANNIATATGATGTPGSFGISQFVKIGDFMDGNVNYRVDELRFASSLTGATPTVVPEPSSVALLLTGLGVGVGLIRKRRSA
jgi:hypothetical protein